MAKPMRHHKRFNIRLYIMTTLIFLLVGTVVVAGAQVVKTGVSFFFDPQLKQADDQVDEENIKAIESGTGYVNFLLAGTDKGGLRTDTIMVASYNLETKKVTIMSVLRDTRVYVNGKFRKINAAFALGKTDLLLKTLKETFDIDINYYITIENTAFVDLMDELGGVDIDVPYNMNYDDPYQNLHIHLKAGQQHLDGAKCEQFVRWRKNNTGPSKGDIERVQNQQAFMKALFEQKMNLASVTKVRSLFNVIKENVNTNLTLKECLAFVPLVKQMSGDAITTLEMPGEGKTVYGASYYIYDAEATQTILREQMGLPDAVVVPCGTKPSRSASGRVVSSGKTK